MARVLHVTLSNGQELTITMNSESDKMSNDEIFADLIENTKTFMMIGKTAVAKHQVCTVFIEELIPQPFEPLEKEVIHDRETSVCF